MSRNIKIISAVIGALALLALAFYAGCRFSAREIPAAEPALSAETPAEVTVHFVCPDSEELVSVVRGEPVNFPDAADIPSYTFLGWRDEENRMQTGQSRPIEGETVFWAVYTVALETKEHRVYLFPDEQGRYRPDAEMSRGDAAIMLYRLLAFPPESEGSSFVDLTPDSPFYEAADALVSLGVIGSGRFHPDDGITRAELLEMLCAFFPATAETFDFADLDTFDSRYAFFCTAAARGWIESGEDVPAAPDAVLTRAETAALMNRVLGRSADPKANDRLTGHLLDLPESDAAYADMLEACIPHSWKTDATGERWTNCTRVKTVKAGLYLDGYELYAVDETGHLVRGSEYQGFAFDAAGRYTSGDAEVDALVRELLPRVLEPEMEREEMLHAVYRYMVNNYRYLRRNYYARLDTSWMLDEAKVMLSTGKGNCYSFAAAFCVAARALGYDAAVYSGAYRIHDTSHAWVDINIDGKRYMFDPEIENAIVHNESNANLYMMTPEIARQYPYIR